MIEPDLNAAVQAAHERLSALVQRAEAPDADPRAALREVVADLSATVEELAAAAEELQIGEEELRQQNEQLTLARSDLEAERARYADLFEFAPEPYLVTDASGVILEANQPASALLHVPHGRLVGKPLFLFTAERSAPDLLDRLRDIGTVGEAQRWELRMQARAGKPFTASAMVLPVRDADGKVVAVRWALRDISERRRLELELARVARVRAVMAEMTEVALRAETPEELFERACHVVVATGHFTMAWIGLVDEAGREVRPVVQCGFGESYLAGVRISTEEVAEGLGPTGTAARTGRPDLCHDFTTDPRMGPWREQALQRGYRSSGAFPLRADDRVFGVLTVYAAEPEFFGEQESGLLEALAADISLAARSIEARQARIAAQASVSEHARRLDALFTHTLTPLVLLDRDLRFVRVNRAFAESHQRALDEFPGHHYFEFSPATDRPIFEGVRATKQPFVTRARPMESPDRPGQVVTFWDWSLAPILDAEGEVEFLVLSLSNVTDLIDSQVELKMHQANLEALVTERTLQLARQERLYRTIVNTANEGIWMGDAQWRTTFVNERYAQMTGYTVEELLALPAIELVAEEFREQHGQARGRRQQGEPQQYDSPIRCKDGSVRWTLVSAAPLFDAEGNFAGSLCLVTDITERRAADEERERLHREVEAQRRTLEAILQAAPVGICLVDSEDLTVKLTNDAYLSYLEEPYSSVGVVGLKLTDFIPRAEEGGIAAAFRHVGATGEALDNPEFAHEGYQRGTTYWRRAMRPLPGDAPGKLDVLTVISDITAEVTARKRIEELAEQAQASATELDAVISTIADGVVVYDAEGRTVRANEAATHIIGWSEREIGQPIGERVRSLSSRLPTGEPLPLEQAPGHRAVCGETVRNFVSVMRGPDGGDLWISTSGAPLFRADGSPNGAVVTFTDITGLVTAEREAQAQRHTLQTIIDNVNTAIVVVSGPDLRVQWSNGAYLRWQNEPYRSAGVTGLRVQDFIPQAEEGGIAGIYRTVAATGQPHFDPEFRFDAFDVGPRYFRRAFIPLPSGTEGEWDVMGVLDDITAEVNARKRIEELAEQAQASAAQLEAIINSMTEGLVVADTEGNITQMNPAALALHGFDTIEECRRHFAEYGNLLRIEYPDGRPIPMELWPLVRATHGETADDYEVRITREDTGHGGLWAFNFAPVRDAQGNVVLGINTIRDITAQRAAEEERERLTQRLQQQAALLDLAPVLARDPDDRIVVWGQGMADLYGYTAEEALGQVSHDLLRTAHPEPLADIRGRLEAEGSWQGELAHRTADGRAITVVSRQVAFVGPDGELARILEVNTDITEREHLLAEVQRSNSTLQTLLDTVPAGVVACDAEGHFTLTNRFTEVIFGGPIRGDAYGPPAPDTIHRVDGRPLAARDLPLPRAIERNETTRNLEFMVRQADGAATMYESSASPLHDAEGRITGAIGILQNITGRKAAERERELLAREVERQAAMLAGILDTTPAGLVIWNGEDMTVKWCNANWQGFLDERLRGRDLLGMPIEGILPVTAESDPTADIRAVAATGEPRVNDELLMPWPGQGDRYWSRHAVPMPRGKGERCDVLVTVADITEQVLTRKRIEGLLAEVEAERKRLFDVLAILPGYVCLLTPEYGFSFVNRRFIELFGEPQPRQKCYNLLFGRETPCDVCHSFECLETGAPVEWEWRSPLETDFEIYDYPFDDTDGTRSVLEVGFDVTERKRAAQEILRHRDHLNELVEERTTELQITNVQLAQEVAQRKGAEAQLLKYQESLRDLASDLVLSEERVRRALATGIHDEISQPLAFARIKIGMLRQAAPSDEARESLVEVEDVLKQAIQTSRTLTFEASPPVLYQLGLDAALQWLADDMRARGVINSHFATEGEPVALGDDVKVMLFQAVRELLANAAKHSQAENVSVSVRWRPNHVRIMVVDDGVGFTPPTEGEGGASGFGLFNIRERINHLGGALHIESCAGGGAKFTIVAPAAGRVED